MDEINRHGTDPHGHEVSDVDVRAVSKFGVGLVLGVIAASFLMWFLFDQFARNAAEHATPPGPMESVNPQKEPPEPRLEKSPVIDFQKFRATEEEKISSYGWIDPEKGIVRIPVSRAMDLVTKEGLK